MTSDRRLVVSPGCRHHGQLMRQRRSRSERGASFIAVLMAMLIVGALYFGYLKLNTAKSERAVGIAAIDASRVVACRTNRQTIERSLVMWSVNHPDEAPSLAALEADGIGVPSCPEGGRYELEGRQVQCSKHP